MYILVAVHNHFRGQYFEAGISEVEEELGEKGRLCYLENRQAKRIYLKKTL